MCYDWIESELVIRLFAACWIFSCKNVTLEGAPRDIDGVPVLRRGDKALLIQPGDTLWEISRDLNLPVDSLVELNGGDARSEPPPPPFQIPKMIGKYGEYLNAS